MTRKEIYAKIKSLNLASEIKGFFGDNYTRITSANLEAYIERYEAQKKKTSTKKATKSTSVDPVIVRLISTLQAGCIISKADADFVLTGK